MALALAVEMSAMTRSARSSSSYIGTSMTPECITSSARMQVRPQSVTAGLMIAAYVAARSSVRTLSPESVFLPKPLMTKQVLAVGEPPLSRTVSPTPIGATVKGCSVRRDRAGARWDPAATISRAGPYCEPSVLAHAMNTCATDLPSATPVTLSMGKWIPAQILESPPSLPIALMKSARVGKRYARISARDEENVEWFDG